jgi:SAM-dependent methyltransferase
MEFAEDVSQRYDDWYESAWGRYADVAEKRLFDRLAHPRSGETVLDVGCGTGRYLRWLHDRGLRATGVDVSLNMVTAARLRLTDRGADERAFVADASALPFGESSFDLVTAITSLEFLSEPERSLREMWRVCRGRLFLGVLSRHSLYARQIGRKGPASSLAKARLYGLGELLRLVRSALSPCTCTWRTALLAPEMHSTAGVALARVVDGIPGANKLPWGAYIGLVVHAE